MLCFSKNNIIVPLKKNYSTGFENWGYFLKFENFLTDQIMHNTFYIIFLRNSKIKLI